MTEMTEIRKFEGVDPDDATAVERAFEQIDSEPIACCNWAEAYPYAPDVSFRMFHSGKYLFLRFDVAERYTAARVTEDNGRVWTDSCVEFFIATDNSIYYNFETTCIGKLLLGARKSRTEAEHASEPILKSIRRYTSLPGLPFAEREGDNCWQVTLAIPPQALFRHGLSDWSGLEARINLFKCGDDLSHPHFLSWQPIRSEKPDFHRPEFFAPVRFAE